MKASHTYIKFIFAGMVLLVMPFLAGSGCPQSDADLVPEMPATAEGVSSSAETDNATEPQWDNNHEPAIETDDLLKNDSPEDDALKEGVYEEPTAEDLLDEVIEEEVMGSMPGDLNGDQWLDGGDAELFTATFRQSFGATTADEQYNPLVDMDSDGAITWVDLQLFENELN